MPTHNQWPEVLEEQAYLVQMLSEATHDSGALEQTCSLLETLRADLRSCTIQVAHLEKENRDPSGKHQDPKTGSSASRFFHRVAGSVGSDHGHESKDRDRREDDPDKHERFLAAWTRKRTLGTEVKNLEAKAQLLRRRIRHHDELQRRLATLYARIFDGKKHSSREEEEAEDDARRAQSTLHEIQKSLDRHKTLTALLTQADYALINAAHHLSTAGSNGSLAEVDAAKTCAVQTSIVIDQAKRLDPNFFEQEKVGHVLSTGWLGDVFHPTSPVDNDGPRSALQLKALKPHHTALLSLIHVAHKQAHEHDDAAHRATVRCEEARARRNALRRRVLVAYANAEAGNGLEGDGWTMVEHMVDEIPEKDGPVKMKDITAGLDDIIPIAVPHQSKQRHTGEETQQSTRDGLADVNRSRVHPPTQLHPRIPPSIQQLRTPSPTLESSLDLRNQAQPSFVSHKLRQPSSIDLTLHQGRRSPQLGKTPHLNLQNDQAPQPAFDRSPLNSRARASSNPGTMDPSPHPPPRSSPLTQPPARATAPKDAEPAAPSQTLKSMQLPSLSPTSLNLTTLWNLDPSPDSRAYSSASNPGNVPGDAGPNQVQPTLTPHLHPHRKPPPPLVASANDSLPSSNEPAPTAKRPLTRPDDSNPTPNLTDFSGHSRSSSDLLQGRSQVAVAQSLPQRPAIQGILKSPTAVAPQRPSILDSSDPWGGVKSAAATSSRPQPKLKTVFNLWRSAEGFKSSDSNLSTHAPTPTPPEPLLPPPKKPNPKAVVQRLRFVETVQLIPRPAVDSDPYEDEDEKSLPPSPRRGSLIWLQEQDEPREGSEEGHGGHPPNADLRPEVGVSNPAFTSSPTGSNAISSSGYRSETHLSKAQPIQIEQSSTSAISQSNSFPNSSTSASSLFSYYATSDDSRALAVQQRYPPDDEGDPVEASNTDHRRRREAATPNTWSGLASDPSSRDTQYPLKLQSMGGALEKGNVSHDDLRVKNSGVGSVDKRQDNLLSSGLKTTPDDAQTIPHSLRTLPPLVTRGTANTKSDHELLSSIFPSPPRSTVSDRKLLFSG